MPALPCTCVAAVLIRVNEAGAVALEVIDIKETTSYRLGHRMTAVQVWYMYMDPMRYVKQSSKSCVVQTTCKHIHGHTYRNACPV